MVIKFIKQLFYRLKFFKDSFNSTCTVHIEEKFKKVRNLQNT